MMKWCVVVETIGSTDHDVVITGFRSHHDAASWAGRVIADRLRWWIAQQATAAEITAVLRA